MTHLFVCVIIAVGGDVGLRGDFGRQEFDGGPVVHDTGIVGIGRRGQVPQVAGRRNSGRGRTGIVIGYTAPAVITVGNGVTGVVVERRVGGPDRGRSRRSVRLLPEVGGPVDG